MIEGKMVGWHHRLNGHEFDQALGDGEDREAWHAGLQTVGHDFEQSHEQTEQTKDEVSCTEGTCLGLPLLS